MVRVKFFLANQIFERKKHTSRAFCLVRKQNDRWNENWNNWWAYRSHCRNVHDAIIHSDTIKTSSTVPGQMVINVFNTNLWMGNYFVAYWMEKDTSVTENELDVCGDGDHSQ